MKIDMLLYELEPIEDQYQRAKAEEDRLEQLFEDDLNAYLKEVEAIRGFQKAQKKILNYYNGQWPQSIRDMEWWKAKAK